MAKKDFTAAIARRNAQDCDAALDREYNNMFGLPTGSETVVKLPINCLHPYKDDPFKDRSGDEMERLAESIRENGLQYPVIVRPMAASGQYEILAGRRRTNAVRLGGGTEIDAIIREVSDDEAVMIVTETNLRYREKLLPSEKAFAYKLQLDAIKRQGKRTDLEDESTSTQIARRRESATIIAENNDVSKDDIRRHIRLTYLIPPLLTLIDDDAIPFIAGVNISYLDEASQTAVHDYFFGGDCVHKLDIRASESLRGLCSQSNLALTADSIKALFANNDKQKVPKSFSISRGKFKKYADKLPDDNELERLFLEFLETRFGT